MNKKILYITNISNGVSSFSVSAVRTAKKLGYEFYLAGNFVGTSKKKLEHDENDYGIKIYQIDLSRSPYSKKNFKAYKQIIELIESESIDYIHCNTPVGGLLGRLAGEKCKVKRIIYQVHGFHFFAGAPKKNWCLYYPIEKWLAKKTDAIITINEEDFKRASSFRLRNNGQVYYVPGVGVDLGQFVIDDEVRKEKRLELDIQKEDIVLVSAGELNINKNNRVIIEALAKIKNDKVHYFICGQGELEKELRTLAENKGIKKQVHFLGYRTDMKELLLAADVFVMPSIREGLSRSIMEAMASGLPCLVSRIRGNCDLIIDNEGGYLCNPYSVDEFSDGINKLLLLETRCRFGIFNKTRVKKFSIDVVQDSLIKCYKNVFED